MRAPWALEALTSELEGALRHGLRVPRDDRLVWSLHQLRQGLQVCAGMIRDAWRRRSEERCVGKEE